MSNSTSTEYQIGINLAESLKFYKRKFIYIKIHISATSGIHCDTIVPDYSRVWRF